MFTMNSRLAGRPWQSDEMKQAALAPRSDFPITDRLAYLNSAAIGPVPKPVQARHAQFAQALGENGTTAYFKNVDQILEAPRIAAARLFGAAPDDVAMVHSVSEAINQVAWWLRPARGRNVVSIDLECPATTFPWLRIAEETGLDVRLVRIADDPASLTFEKVVALVDDATTAICVSHVQWVTGHRLNLRRLADLAHSHGALLLVDAFHSAGIVPLNVVDDDVDVLAAGSFKWLCGYSGIAACYIRRELSQRMRPILAGARTSNPAPPYDALDATTLTFANGARNLEYSGSSHLARIALADTIGYVLKLGVDKILCHSQLLAAKLASGIDHLGGQVVTPRESAESAGIVTARFTGVQAVAMTAELERRGIIVSPRNGLIRFALHMFNNEDDVDRTLNGIEDFLRSGL